MYKISDFKKQFYKISEAAELLGLSAKTLRLYDKAGTLKVTRSDGNHRLIPRDEIIRILDERGLIVDDTLDKRRDVIYARVSSHDQKNHGDLDRQALFLVESVPDMQNPLILKEVGSGLNDNRKKLKELLYLVSKGEVRNVYVTYKDRLTRFGFSYLKTMFESYGTKIIVVKDSSESKTVEEELVEDMMSLVASFSGKLYGMRSRRKEKSK